MLKCMFYGICSRDTWECSSETLNFNLISGRGGGYIYIYERPWNIATKYKHIYWNWTQRYMYAMVTHKIKHKFHTHTHTCKLCSWSPDEGFEEYSHQRHICLITLLVNFPCKLGPIMTSDMTYERLDKWFLAILQHMSILPIYTFHVNWNK